MAKVAGHKWRLVGALAGILILTGVIYLPVRHNEFVSFDDPKYITENAIVQKGLTTEGVKWAFTATQASNWHPLTWLSLMADCQFLGLVSGRHHLVNIALHLVNTALVLLIFFSLTRDLWPSAFVAGLFALHPLHVESVAWAAERKDVLSACFSLLAIWAYAGYVRRPAALRYLAVAGFFALALMSKPMAVTLPVVLLLLDWWPLERIGKDTAGLRRTLIEKLPFFVMAAASSVITWIVGRTAAMPLSQFGLYRRIANAVIAYGVYLGKMVWPTRLAVLYPLPKALAAWQVIVSAAALAAVTAFVIWQRRRRRYLLTGWLWYIGTLVPVIGLVQVGFQQYADRYTYVPLIGAFLIIAWGIKDISARWRSKEILLWAGAAVLLAGPAVLTAKQISYWRNSETLYRRALAVTNGNFTIHNNLGVVLKEKGRLEEAAQHWRAALEIFPMYEEAIVNLGGALEKKGDIDEAIGLYQNFLTKGNGGVMLHNNFGNALKAKGLLSQAIREYRKAFELGPGAWQVRFNLGLALLQAGQLQQAEEHLKASLAINPGLSSGYYWLGQVLTSQGRDKEAAGCYRRALELNPRDKQAIDALKAAEAAGSEPAR